MRISRLRDLACIMAVTFVGLFCSPGANAQTIPSPYRFLEGTHDAGVIFGVVQEKRGALGIGPGGGPLFGARYAIELRGPIALELAGYQISTDRVVYDAVPNEGLVPLGNADTMVTGVDARIRFSLTGARTWHGVAPFLMFGGGLVGNLSGPSEFDAELPSSERFSFGPSFLGVMGGGTRWIPFERLTLRVETSLSLWKLGTPVGFSDVEEDLEVFVRQEWIGVGSLVFGASYRF